MPRGPLASIPSPARSIWHWGPVPLRAQELAIVAGIVVAVVVADRRYRNAGGPRGGDIPRRDFPYLTGQPDSIRRDYDAAMGFAVAPAAPAGR